MSGRLLVLGNAGWDLPMALPRLPREGETLLGERLDDSPGGKGLNQAVVAARAGARVTFVAALGTDRNGEAVTAALAREALEFRPLASPRRTDISVLCVAPEGGNLIVSSNACADAVTPAQAEAAASTLGQGDLLLMQCGLPAETTLAAARVAAARRARMVLNAAPFRWPLDPLLPLLHALVLNEVEAEAATGCANPSEAAQRLLAGGTARVVVTLGAEGAVAADVAGIAHHPAPPTQARDTTGAGDVFCGTFAAALLAGHPDPVRPGQLAAAWSVARQGCYASFPAAEVLAALLAS